MKEGRGGERKREGVRFSWSREPGSAQRKLLDRRRGFLESTAGAVFPTLDGTLQRDERNDKETEAAAASVTAGAEAP